MLSNSWTAPFQIIRVFRRAFQNGRHFEKHWNTWLVFSSWPWSETGHKSIFGCFGIWYSDHYCIKTYRRQSQCLDLYCIQQNDPACNFWWNGKTDILIWFQKTLILPVLFSDIRKLIYCHVTLYLYNYWSSLSLFWLQPNLLEWMTCLSTGHIFICICTKQPHKSRFCIQKSGRKNLFTSPNF